MTVQEQIEQLKVRQERIWAEALPFYLESVSCELGLCGKADAIQDSIAAEGRPERKAALQARLESLKHERLRPWQKALNEVRKIQVTIETLKQGAA